MTGRIQRARRWGVGLAIALAAIFLWGTALAQGTGPITLLIHPTLYEATGGDGGLVAEFTEQTGIEVNVVTAPTDQLRERAVIEYVAGTGRFDVATLQNAWMNEEITSFLAPLDAYVAGTDDAYNFGGIIDSLLSINTVGGQLVAMPFRSGTTMMYYRTDLLEAAGVDVPQTMDELMAAAAALTQDTDGDGQPDVRGMVLRGRAGFEMTQDFNRTLLAHGGSVLNEDMTACTLDNAAGVATISMWADLFQNGHVPPDMLSLGRDDQIRLLQTGGAAMGIYFSPYYGRIVSEVDPELIGWTVVPTSPGVEEGRGLNVLWSLGIDENSSDKDAAFELVKWLTNEQHQTLMAVEYSNAPVRGATYQDEAFVAKNPMGEDWLAATAASGFEPPHPRYPEMVDIISVELTSALEGEKTPERAAEDACQAISSLL